MQTQVQRHVPRLESATGLYINKMGVELLHVAQLPFWVIAVIFPLILTNQHTLKFSVSPFQFFIARNHPENLYRIIRLCSFWLLHNCIFLKFHIVLNHYVYSYALTSNTYMCKDNANEWKRKIKRVLILFSRVQLIFTEGRIMQTNKQRNLS